jgi:hypothetical protein
MPLVVHLLLGFVLGVAIVAGYWAYQRFVVEPSLNPPPHPPASSGPR